MQLKRFYDFDAPQDDWVRREEPCPVCDGKGRVMNEAATDIVDCPVGDPEAPEHYWEAGGGQGRFEYAHVERSGQFYRVQYVPPVSEIEVQRAGAVQHFSPRIVETGRREGWLSLEGTQLRINGRDRTLVYLVDRIPGRYPDPEREGQYEQINYYDCSLVEELETNG